MSKIWLNGKITGHELRTLHPLEYRKILEERRRAVKPVMTTRDEVARSSDTQARP
jgi:hypothetical protein